MSEKESLAKGQFKQFLINPIYTEIAYFMHSGFNSIIQQINN